jgi:hypothetical protein
MNTNNKRIDRSVNSQVENAPVKNLKNYVPMHPISTAEELKSALAKRLSAEYDGVASRLVHQAINEACALASLTLEPLLFLPALAEEKVQQAAAWSARQHSLLDTRTLAHAA